MKVLYDSTCFSQEYGGVSRYYCEMTRRLPEGIKAVIPLKQTVNRYLQAEPFFVPRMKGSVHDFVRERLHGWYMPGVSCLHRVLSFISPKMFPSGERINRQAIEQAVAGGDYDLYHVTGPNYYDKLWKKVKARKPIVVTVHDLIFDKIMKDRRVIRGRRGLLGTADAIIAVSEFTKNEIVEFYGVRPEKIFVVHHGITFKVEAPVGDKGFLLYVGQRRGYKNWEWFVRAVAPLMIESGLRLVCTGNAFATKEERLLKSLGIRELSTAQFVADKDMPRLYAEATAFVYPSECEGFGLPILDAWACGCPVVLSRSSCFPEIARGAASYFDLGDENGLREAIRQVQGEFRAAWAKKGFAELTRFSWEQCAMLTAEVYKSVV